MVPCYGPCLDSACQVRGPCGTRHGTLRTKNNPSAPPPQQMAACHLGGGGPDAHGTVAAPPLPFTLIQGPPGTGKTHTVKVKLKEDLGVI